MLRGLILVFAVVLAGGCATQSSAGPGGDADGSSTGSLAARVSDESRLAVAEEVLVDECMRVRGQDYSPTAPLPTDWGLEVGPLEAGDVADARRWGLGLRRPPVPPPDPDRALLEALDPLARQTWSAALTGSPRAR